MDPSKYIRVRRENDKFGPGISAIWGVTEDKKVELQAVRFDKDKYTPEEARKWLADHKMKTIEFAAATDAPAEKKDATCETCGRTVVPEALYPDEGKAMCALCAVKARGKRRKPKKGGIHILGTSRSGGAVLGSSKAAEVKAGKRVQGARVEQVRQVLDAFQALGDEIADLLDWAQYADVAQDEGTLDTQEDIVLTAPQTGSQEEIMAVNLEKARGLLGQLAEALTEPTKALEADETPEAKAAAGREALKKRLMGIVGELNAKDCDMDKCTEQVVSLADELRPKEPPKEAKAEEVVAETGAQGTGAGDSMPDDGTPAQEAVTKDASLVPLTTTCIKALTQDDKGVTVGGYLLLWGAPNLKDLGGDFFTPKTKLWLDEYKQAPCLFHHGLDGKVGMEVMGHRLESGVDEKGAWVKDWLDKSKKYWEFVKPLLEAEKLHYSPGSAPHLVERKGNGELVSFACIEDTMTPVPMQHRLAPLEEIRAAYKSAGIEIPAYLSEPTAQAPAAPTIDVDQWLAEQELALLAEE